MRLRKMAAGIIAAAMAVASLPQAVSASSAEPEFDVGDTFYVEFDPNTGKAVGTPSDSFESPKYNACYHCTILDDGTISVATSCKLEYTLPHIGRKITIPEQIAGYTITQIDSMHNVEPYLIGGFSSITIPDTVKIISEYAFYRCVFLEEVNFGTNSQLELIGRNAFTDCRSLKSITIPANVEKIESGVFFNNAQDPLAYGNISGIPQNMDFTDVFSLETVKFAEGSKLKEIGDSAFYNQISLASIELPDSVESIGNYAFTNTALESVRLPASVDTIGFCVFNRLHIENDVMSPISTPSVLTNIYVDENNTTFKSVDGVVYSKDGTELVAYPIGRNAEMVIPEGTTKIRDGICYGSYITSLIVPSTLTELPDYAFSFCYNLTEVNLPKTLTKIGSGTFTKAPFTSITIPASVTSINQYAFYLSDLKTIYGVEGSYAETYAKENGYEFNGTSAPDEPTPDDSNTFTDEKTGAKVVDTNGALPENAEMSVTYNDKDKDRGEVSYIISFKDENGEVCNPTSNVEVWLPIPEEFQEDFQKNERFIQVFIRGVGNPDVGYQDGSIAFITPRVGEIIIRDWRIIDEENQFEEGYSSIVTDEETGISVSGVIPGGTQLVVTSDTENNTDTRLFFDISLVKDGKEYQPEGKVTVKIPVPEEFKDKADTLKVYHFADGKYENMSAKLEDGYLVFETDHFSIYVVTPETISEDGGEDTTDTEPTPSTRPNTGDFIVPETTTNTATAADTTSAPQAAETTATVADTTTTAAATTTTTAAPEATTAAPDTSTAEQPVPTGGTSDSGSANVGNDGAANNKGDNPDTGYAIAIVPMIVAAAAVSFIAYKRKK